MDTKEMTKDNQNVKATDAAGESKVNIFDQ